MRKIIGFIFFIISAPIIVAVMIGSKELLGNAFEALSAETLFSEEFFLQIGVVAALLWELLYQPIVVLLLSVLAMGRYSK